MRKESGNLGHDKALNERLEALGVREVLFELHAIGSSVRVTALDPRSGTEVVAVCEAARGEKAMKRMAANKLAYVLEKKKRPNGDILA